MPHIVNCPKCSNQLGRGVTRCWRLGCTFVVPQGYSTGLLTHDDSPGNLQDDEDEDDDPFSNLLVDAVAEISDAIENIANLSDKEPDQFMNVVRETNPGSLSRRLILKVDGIESFVNRNIDWFLDAEEGTSWHDIARPLLPSGWLRNDLTDEIMELERVLRDLKDAAQDYGRYWRKNKGIGGVISRMVKAYANPLDGYLHYVGKGSNQIEGDELIEDLSDAFACVNNGIETFITEVGLRTRLKLSAIQTHIP